MNEVIGHQHNNVHQKFKTQDRNKYFIVLKLKPGIKMNVPPRNELLMLHHMVKLNV